MRCENKVSQTYYRDGEFMPRTIELRCGSTSIHGSTLVCGTCQDKHHDGWPDRCRHGVLYTQYDVDCAACELGED